ncbi:dTDP-4-dehydrorhamnose 3,5-epimerase [Desulfobacca acetoxidans]
MRILATDLPEIKLIEPRVFTDRRGYFFDIYQALGYSDHGIEARFVQDSLSYSLHGVVRGLHYQLRRPQGKLITVLQGEVIDVVVDIRLGSKNFARWTKNLLSADNHRQLFVPPGFAHGFTVISEAAAILYKCTDYYDPLDEYGILWNDSRLGIDWPVTAHILSDKDARLPLLRDVPDNLLPQLTD